MVTVKMFGPLRLKTEFKDFSAELHSVREAILRYGFRLKADNYTEYVVTDRLSAVTERVRAEVAQAGDELAAVIQGVDEPWDVALVELWMREVRRSADGNIRELQEQGKLF